MNLFGIKRYLIALFPGDNRTGISNGSACGEFFNRSGVTGSINFCGNVWRIFADQTKTHQSLFVYEHEDDSDDDDPHHGKPSAHSSVWHAIWLIIHLIAVIAVTKMNASPLETLLDSMNALSPLLASRWLC